LSPSFVFSLQSTMIQLKTILNCIDNTVYLPFPGLFLCDCSNCRQGAVLVECIHVLGGGKQASIGDRIVVVVKTIRLQTEQQIKKNVTSVLPKVNRGEIKRATVVRAKQQVSRKDGTFIGFDDNACVLVDDKGEPLGNRIMGIVSCCQWYLLFRSDCKGSS